MTPLYGADMISKDQIEAFEIYLKKTQLAIPNDIKSRVVKNITNWSRIPISVTIQRIHAKMILKHFNKPLIPIPRRFLENKPLIIALPKEIRNLMFATTCNRTALHYHQRHYCHIHDVIVDQHHLSECSKLNRFGPADKFVTTVRNFRLSDLSGDFC